MKKSNVRAIINRPQKNQGITLIALIVTIIILIILAGIAIGLISGSEGLMSKTSSALDKNEEATATEKMELKITYFNMISYGENTRKATLQELAEGLFQDKEIDYIKIKENKIASLEKIDVTGEKSIFVKLKEYPYEFEIGSDLQLASVDGIQIANAKTSTNHILWEGKSENGSELVLSDDLDQYSFIEIYFRNIDGVNKSASAILKFDVSNIISEGTFSICDFCRWVYLGVYDYDKENNKFINTDNHQMNHDKLFTGKFCLEIYKIVGIK